MMNVDSVSKKFKFFDENWPENYFCQKLPQHAAQLNGVSSINEKFFSISKLTIKAGLKDLPFAL